MNEIDTTEEDDGPDWRQQQECEQQQIEEEQAQALLAADPGYLEWLARLAAEAAYEQQVKHGDHG